MATDIVYERCTWTPPNEICGFLDNKTLINWALRFISFEGNWILLRPFSCSKAELKTLSDSLPDVGTLKYDHQSALTIFFHLGKPSLGADSAGGMAPGAGAFVPQHQLDRRGGERQALRAQSQPAVAQHTGLRRGSGKHRLS